MNAESSASSFIIQTSYFNIMSTFTREAVKKLSAYLNEPAWMLEFRLAAFDAYETPMPMPTTDMEAWRRTDIRRFKWDQTGPSVNGDAGAEAVIPEYLGKQLTTDEAGGNMLQVDGVVKEYPSVKR
jgi:Fe-S cluster assembly protein SufD